MGHLDNYKIYLAGPIDRAADDGIGWRNDFKERIYKINPYIKFLDPCDKPEGLGSEVAFEKTQVHEWKKNGEFDKVTDFVKNYRRIDLRMVDVCNIFVIYVDTDLHMCGSYNELHFAEATRKPIIAVLKNGKKDAPDWLFAQVNHQYMFDSVSEACAFLECVNYGSIETDNKWICI